MERDITELQRLADDAVEVNMFSNKWDKTWHIVFTKSTEGVKLEVTAKNESFPAALREALDKWSRIVGGGIHEFAGPLIENHAPAIDSDGIPF